ncbi:hypothetical protein AB1L88_05475 [Tautonia sp. JC769]|uniref:hypothetical protein n=1 Tax=Tautonia sp. JC769 TaxID=3232135 RepID=UPI0034582F15
MSVRDACIWLTLLASVAAGGEVVCQPGDDGARAPILSGERAGWDRPAREAPTGRQPATAEGSAPATASESEEDVGGPGLVAWEPQAIVPFDPSRLGSARASTLPLVRAPRPIARLRC